MRDWVLNVSYKTKKEDKYVVKLCDFKVSLKILSISSDRCEMYFCPLCFIEKNNIAQSDALSIN